MTKQKEENKISKDQIEQVQEKIQKAKSEIAKVLVGQENLVEKLLQAIFVKGHILLEGVPGIAKTTARSTTISPTGFGWLRPGVWKRLTRSARRPTHSRKSVAVSARRIGCAKATA